MRRLWWLTLVLVVSSCGGADDRADTIEGRTTTSAAATVDPTAPSGPLNEAQLSAALLTIEDMETGFAADTDQDEGKEGVCNKPATSTVVPSFAEAKVVFSKGTFGPFVQQITASYDASDGAQLYMAEFRKAAGSCTSYVQTDDDGEKTITKITALAFPRLGDDTFALRFSTDQAKGDVVLVRVGNTMTRVSVVGLAIDSTLTERMGRKAVAKVQAVAD